MEISVVWPNWELTVVFLIACLVFFLQLIGKNALVNGIFLNKAVADICGVVLFGAMFISAFYFCDKDFLGFLLIMCLSLFLGWLLTGERESSISIFSYASFCGAVLGMVIIDIFKSSYMYHLLIFAVLSIMLFFWKGYIMLRRRKENEDA